MFEANSTNIGSTQWLKKYSTFSLKFIKKEYRFIRAWGPLQMIKKKVTTKSLYKLNIDLLCQTDHKCTRAKVTFCSSVFNIQVFQKREEVIILSIFVSRVKSFHGWKRNPPHILGLQDLVSVSPSPWSHWSITRITVSSQGSTAQWSDLSQLKLHDPDTYATSLALESSLSHGADHFLIWGSKTCSDHPLSCVLSITRGRHPSISRLSV